MYFQLFGLGSGAIRHNPDGFGVCCRVEIRAMAMPAGLPKPILDRPAELKTFTRLFYGFRLK